MEWKPIETAPKDGTWILAFGNGENIMECFFIADFDDELGWIETYSEVVVTPTHWMHLPPFPETR